MKFKGTPAKPKKIGTTQVIDAETGEVKETRQNAGMLLGPPPDKCQVCAVDHPHDQPHNQESLYYQMAFHSTHGRWPTWTDAMQHCAPDVQAHWKACLIEAFKKRGQKVPDDLLTGPAPGR